jgi:DNA (cytosine-5)-methyltransferase 1
MPNNKKIRVATVFSGIGAIEFALKRLEIEHEIVFACDNGNVDIDINVSEELTKIKSLHDRHDKKLYVDELYKCKTRKTNFVKKSYLANYGLDENFYYQDIRLFDGLDYTNEVDLFVGGSPCQSFSTVGFQAGLEDARGTLFYDYARLIEEIQPKVFIFENVRGLYTHDKRNTWEIIEGIFKSLNYDIHYDLLNAKNFGIPQNRTRLFVVGFKQKTSFEMPKKRNVESNFSMQDFLIENNDQGSLVNEKTYIRALNISGTIDDKYFLTPKLYAYVMKGGTKSFYQKPTIDLSIARPILATMGNRHRAGIDNYVTVNGKVRMLSEREAHRLMGFTDDYEIVVSRAQAYKQAGNSIVVDVLMGIIEKIVETQVFR